jgi:small subunit ribosomal protein S17
MTETTESVTTEAAEAAARSRRKVRLGRVVSDRMDKTAVVSIERLVKHPVYGRYVRRREKFKVHDEQNQCHTGDLVRFMETRRMSKDKRWRLVEIVERAK